MSKSSFGVIGLGVMGRNLVLNLESRGHSIAVFNRTEERTRAFADSLSEDLCIRATFALGDFVSSLETPRKVLLMVQAGHATDATLEQLLPLLAAGDVVMDGGNAHFTDTDRRLAVASERGIQYLGVGVSGGEFGALHGPSIMPGGSEHAYEIVGSILESIAATGPEGTCCAYLGPGSAGHYVKMVHNGIEYALMEVLAEAYDIMTRGLDMTASEIADTFRDWNRGNLESYLVEISEPILRHIDPVTGEPLIEQILDTASQKGTGKWTTQSALDVGSPVPSIAAAVFARIVSSLKAERISASPILVGPEPAIGGDRHKVLDDLFSAVLLATVIAYAQGFRQLRDASTEQGYALSLPEVARVWMAGCIIRAKLLVPVGDAFRADPDLAMLLTAEPFRSMWTEQQAGFRRLVSLAHGAGIPVPAMSSALEFADAYRTGRLPANFLQAQRDFFGAHTYQRIDGEGAHHTEWHVA